MAVEEVVTPVRKIGHKYNLRSSSCTCTGAKTTGKTVGVASASAGIGIINTAKTPISEIDLYPEWYDPYDTQGFRGFICSLDEKKYDNAEKKLLPLPLISAALGFAKKLYGSKPP